MKQVEVDDEPLRRRHSLIGRQIESYFESTTYPTTAVGVVTDIDPTRNETPCEVMYMGTTEPEYLSIQEVVESLVMASSETEQDEA